MRPFVAVLHHFSFETPTVVRCFEIMENTFSTLEMRKGIKSLSAIDHEECKSAGTVFNGVNVQKSNHYRLFIKIHKQSRT